MTQTSTTQQGRIFRKRRVRSRVFGTAVRPRLSVFRSLRSISAQVIDDSIGKTLFSADLCELVKMKKTNTVDGAREVGRLVSKKCHAASITSMVFDRNGYQYHGRVKAVADGVREGGIEM